jgi:hypothetical protein
MTGGARWIVVVDHGLVQRRRFEHDGHRAPRISDGVASEDTESR